MESEMRLYELGPSGPLTSASGREKERGLGGTEPEDAICSADSERTDRKWAAVGLSPAVSRFKHSSLETKRVSIHQLRHISASLTSSLLASL